MESPLRILLLEDDSAFEEVLAGNLHVAGIPGHLTRVELQEEFMDHLHQGGYDLILADYSLPGFDGLSALQIAKAHSPQVPFIFVSGTMGEERAIESLQQGATDYVLKHRLSRLAPAVRRALQEASQEREKKSLEAQLIQAQKMESIGQLAGSLAHDFNNVLSIIRGYTQLSATAANRTREDDDRAQKILHCVDRATRLTRQLLTFSRRQEMEFANIDLNATVENMALMTERLLGKRISIQCSLQDAPAMVRADAAMIEQVLLNLAINARDAMPNGGQIRISTGTIFIDDDYLRAHPQAAPGLTVCLKFEDSGSGIPPELLPRIFEPFFTTKGAGKGTGLGLASVYGIVKQHHGWIDVESQASKGTTFSIFLSAIQPLARTETATTSMEMPTGTETVLVVEDEEAMRALVRNILELCGYTVLEAATGEEALRIWDESGDRIKALITDVVLADGFSGCELARRLMANHAALKVIYTSGYPIGDVRIEVGPLVEGKNFIQKPFQVQKLIHAVRTCLDQ